MDDLRPSWSETESLVALRSAMSAAQRVSPVVARRAGLSHSELLALDHLSRGPLGPGELARLLELTTAAATGVVDRLVSHGHADRVPRADDRRRTEVRLTESGRAEVVQLLLPMFAALQSLDETFDDDERAVVARYLRGAEAAFEAVAGPVPLRQPEEPSESEA
ncbi:MarR family transcriptional regulator [Nocardioides sp.]|uniref:MarR family winged helix-turn-helix transcriptional regulator n=1 Tax=Nocardioides sp. TaxID=35761 RepID=UPI001A340534|nr:MarR family transcriptional regulator [Nocardioides sp.]MBJ7355806.1 MarR family transcriptional regulator [Nocardioides sp.]